MSTSNHGALVTPSDATTVDVTSIFETFKVSAEPGVIGYYADETARDAGTLALRNAARKGMRAFVLAPVAANATGPDWCGWDGTDWVYDHPTPIEWAFGTGAGPVWSQNVDPVNWASATYTFTPTRTGWADVSFTCDVIRVNSGFNTAYAWVKFTAGGGAGSTQIGLFSVLHESQSIRTSQLSIPKPVRLIKGQTATLSLDVSSYQATPGVNQWQFGNFVWSAVQK